MGRVYGRVLLLPMVLSGLACGGDPGMTSPDAAPDSGQCSTMPPDGGAPPSGDMAGTWASLERTYAIPHGFSERQIAWVTYLERHTLSNDGYAVEVEMCTLEIDGEENLTFGRGLAASPGP